MKKQPAINEKRVVALVQKLRSINEQARTIEFVASSEAVDRYGDVIRVSGWDTRNYMRNPVFLWAHRSTDPPIGRTVKLFTESNPPALVQVVEFASKDTYPFADTVFNLYKDGFLSAVSVGFRPTEKPKPIRDKETDQITGFEFIKQELMELSAVPIPANPEALARAAEGGEFRQGDLDIIQRCGEKNSPWAFMVPGATYAATELNEKDEENDAPPATAPKKGKESMLRLELDAKKTHQTVAEVMDKLIETNRNVDALNNTMVKRAELGDTLNRVDEVKSSVRDLTGAVRGLAGVLATKDEVERLVPDFEQLIRKMDKILQNAAKESTLGDVAAALNSLTKQLEKAITGILRRTDLADLAAKVEANRTATASLEDAVAKSADVRHSTETIAEVRDKVDALALVVKTDVAKSMAVDSIVSGLDTVNDRLADVRDKLAWQAGTEQTQSSHITSISATVETLSQRFDIFREDAPSAEDVKRMAEKAVEILTVCGNLLHDVRAIQLKMTEIEERIDTGCQKLDNLTDHVAAFEATMKQREAEQAEERRTVCPYTDDPIADKSTAWDASAEMAKQSNPSGWKHMSTVINGDPKLKGSYKLPHHSGSGFKVIPNGVRAALGRLEQTQMASSDRAGARAHLAKHQKKIAAMKGFDFDAEAFERHLDELGRVYRAAEERGDEAERIAADAMIVRYVEKMCRLEDPKPQPTAAPAAKPEEKTPAQKRVASFLDALRKPKPATEPGDDPDGDNDNDPDNDDDMPSDMEGMSCSTPNCKCEGYMGASEGEPTDTCQRSGCGHTRGVHTGKPSGG